MNTWKHTELSEASEVADVSEAVASIYEKLPHDFRARWEALQGHDPSDLAQRVVRDFNDRPEERREILIAYLAQRLGYSWTFNRQATLVEKPLWELLSAEAFATLSPQEQEILFLVASSTRRVRPALEPRAALAAICLWRHGDDAMRARAAWILRQRPLPSDLDWMFELVRVLASRAMELEVEPEQRLHALFQLQAEAGFHSVVSIGIALYFTRRYGSFLGGTSPANLVRACDAAAADFGPRMAPWIRLAAESTVAAKLSHPWMEPLMAAAIRHLPDVPQNYRKFHALRPYRVSAPRVAELYAGPLALVAMKDAAAGANLLREVDAMWASNPVRARDLLELLIAETGVSRGDRGARLTRVLEDAKDLDPLLERLIALYIITFDLRPGAIGLVQRFCMLADVRSPCLQRWGVSGLDLDIYLASADYEMPLRGHKVMYAGIELEHIDMDAAALVHYFRTKRSRGNAITGLVQNFGAPTDWLATQVSQSPLVDRLFNQTMEAFERFSLGRNHREHVLDLLRTANQAQTFEEVPLLPARSVLRVAQHARHKALLSAAMAGAAAGGIAPATQGASAVLDAPVVMALTAEVCAATCWYFGFDPAEDPTLPMTILSIALGGSGARFETHDEIHRQLHAFLVRKSLILAALGQGAYRAVLGPTLASGIEVLRVRTGRQLSKGRLVRLVKQDAESAWSQRLLETANLYALPVVEGVAGAVLNVALMYDICESAEAVLTDRFLARKYPEWVKTW